MAKRTRVTVKILEGKNLLVSDLLTGTSDPLALLWVGSCEEGEVDLKYDKRVQVTIMWSCLQLNGFVTERVEVQILHILTYFDTRHKSGLFGPRG